TLPAGADEDWMRWDVTAAVQRWADGTWANHGLLVRRDDETLGDSGPVFPAALHPEPAIRPRLEVTYVGAATHLFEPDTVRGNGASLRWAAFDGSSGASFDRWEVHRTLGEGEFTPSEATRIAIIGDREVTSYRDTTAGPERAFSYKVVVAGEASNARTVTTPAAGQARK
ncbi:MAG: DNRLRE domain-containing protein, partial [Alphaproteobacteria bacterium]|nr:DNRLRE domain-containing protein [Alphaproteobacteria bacterium]